MVRSQSTDDAAFILQRPGSARLPAAGKELAHASLAVAVRASSESCGLIPHAFATAPHVQRAPCDLVHLYPALSPDRLPWCVLVLLAISERICSAEYSFSSAHPCIFIQARHQHLTSSALPDPSYTLKCAFTFHNIGVHEAAVVGIRAAAAIQLFSPQPLSSTAARIQGVWAAARVIAAGTSRRRGDQWPAFPHRVSTPL